MDSRLAIAKVTAISGGLVEAGAVITQSGGVQYNIWAQSLALADMQKG